MAEALSLVRETRRSRAKQLTFGRQGSNPSGPATFRTWLVHEILRFAGLVALILRVQAGRGHVIWGGESFWMTMMSGVGITM